MARDDGASKNKGKSAAKSVAKKAEKKSEPKPPTPRLKLIVRKLPPNLPEAIFRKTISAWEETIEWSEFIPGKIYKSAPLKEPELSRAYLKFSTPEALVDFHKGYSGWLFKSEQTGTAYRAEVELAPYQRTPKPKKKVDPRMNTLDSDTHVEDSDYLAFLESLQNPVQEKSEEVVPAVSEKPKTTPLLEALRAKKAQAQAEREQREQGRKVAALIMSRSEQRASTSGRKERERASAKERRGAERPSTPLEKPSKKSEPEEKASTSKAEGYGPPKPEPSGPSGELSLLRRSSGRAQDGP
ncbi:hypothetical protein HDU96_005454, partial [Phlyctochytrium bullatum]